MRLLLSALMLLLCANALVPLLMSCRLRTRSRNSGFACSRSSFGARNARTIALRILVPRSRYDLRQKVFTLMQEGKSDSDIVDYMVARYGNFVTYDPPLTPLTILLWVVPVPQRSPWAVGL